MLDHLSGFFAGFLSNPLWKQRPAKLPLICLISTKLHFMVENFFNQNLNNSCWKTLGSCMLQAATQLTSQRGSIPDRQRTMDTVGVTD